MAFFQNLKVKSDPFNATAIKLIWELIDANDRVLLFLPDIARYKSLTNRHVLASFRESVKKIYKSHPKYVVLFVPNENVDLYEFERVYDVEIQWLTDLDLLHDTNGFMAHHKPRVLYLLTTKRIEPLYSKYFDKAITDTLYLRTCDIDALDIPIRYGKSAFEDILTVEIYIKKFLMNLEGRAAASDMHYDVAFIVGESDPCTTADMLNAALDADVCSLIFNCNPAVAPMLINYNEITCVNYDNANICIDVFSDMTSRLDNLCQLYTTFIFIGKFTFNDKATETKWSKYTETIQNIGIFDTCAFTSLLDEIPDKKVKHFRISKELPKMIDMFVDQTSDPLGIMGPSGGNGEGDGCDDDDDENA
jgi:hypothetical protein